MILDKFDNEILKHLKENSRIPFATLGKTIGLTSPAIAQRVQKMKNEGVINNFTITINPAQLGISIKAIITIKVGFGKFKAFQKELEKFDEVKSWYRVTGEDCMIMHVHLKDNPHMVRFLDQITKYGNTKTNIVLDDSFSEALS